MDNSEHPQGRDRKAITCDCGCGQTDETVDLLTMRICLQSAQRFRDLLEESGLKLNNPFDDILRLAYQKRQR